MILALTLLSLWLVLSLGGRAIVEAGIRRREPSELKLSLAFPLISPQPHWEPTYTCAWCQEPHQGYCPNLRVTLDGTQLLDHRGVLTIPHHVPAHQVQEMAQRWKAQPRDPARRSGW